MAFKSIGFVDDANSTDRSGMSDAQDQAYISALLEELRGYEMHGNTADAASVKAELKRMGYEAEPKEKQASRRGRPRKNP